MLPVKEEGERQIFHPDGCAIGFRIPVGIVHDLVEVDTRVEDPRSWNSVRWSKELDDAFVGV